MSSAGILAATVLVLFGIAQRNEAEYGRQRHVSEAKRLLTQADWALYKWDDGKEFNLESLPYFLKNRKSGTVRLYFEEKDIPTDLKRLLKSADLPYIGKTNFRILTMGALEDKTVIFVRDEATKEDEYQTREIDYNLCISRD